MPGASFVVQLQSSSGKFFVQVLQHKVILGGALVQALQNKVVLGSALCKLCSTKQCWGFPCARFVVQSSTGKCLVQSL